MNLADLAKHVHDRLGRSAHLAVRYSKKSGRVEVRIRVHGSLLRGGFAYADDDFGGLARMVDYVAGVRDIRGNLIEATP